MRKFFLFSIVVLLFAAVAPVFAQQDSDDNGEEQNTASAQETRLNRQAADNVSNGWVEIRITSTSPLVYAPERCISDADSFSTVIWDDNRFLSLEAAREAMRDQDALAQPFNQGRDLLVTVTCDLEIYTTPGGEVIENELLRAGQTWFATPYRWVTNEQVDEVRLNQRIAQTQTTNTTTGTDTDDDDDNDDNDDNDDSDTGDDDDNNEGSASNS